MWCWFQVHSKVIQLYIHILQILSPYRLLQDTEQSPLRYTVGPCWLSLLNIAVSHTNFNLHTQEWPYGWVFQRPGSAALGSSPPGPAAQFTCAGRGPRRGVVAWWAERGRGLAPWAHPPALRPHLTAGRLQGGGFTSPEGPLPSPRSCRLCLVPSTDARRFSGAGI